MSRYTLRLCDVCEVLYNEKDYYLNNSFENMKRELLFTSI